MHDAELLIAQYGLALVFANVLLDQLGLPIPAIPALMVAGALAAGGKLAPLDLFGVAVAATLIADSAWYAAGRRYGNHIMKALCRVSLTPDYCVNQTQTLFERWGLKSLLVANFIPGFATVAPPLAGATHVGWPRFLFYSTLGAFLWVGAGVGVGMVFKEQIKELLALLERTGSVAVLVLAALCAAYLAWKWWERHRFFTKLRMARISVDELYRLMDAGAAPVVVDVRSQTARALNPRRIPGARHVPLRAVDQHAADLPRDREIILYCTCPNEISAAEAAKLLMNSGFTRVRPLHGGLDAWVAAGYRVEALQD
ncbi:MAG TPA: DedA family protein/thiosulfate sulfurtransferase GlpE [Burkholderiales bacterium]|nr:DedA family protein/thiosulfate sulfurtransferase GlpE [Burkholderiales bacterium]